MVKEISITEMMDYFKNKGAIVEKYEHVKEYNILMPKDNYYINLYYYDKCVEINIKSSQENISDNGYSIKLFTTKNLNYKIPLSVYSVFNDFILMIKNINSIHIDNNGDICID